MVCLAPLPFGSLELQTVVFWSLLATSCLLFSPQTLSRPQTMVVAGGMFVGLIYFGISLLQEFRGAVSFHLGLGKAISIASSHLTSSGSLLPFLLDIEMLLLGLLFGANAKRARHLLFAIACSGVAYALYGMISNAIEPTLLLWRERSDFIGVVIGTFINRNTAASFFGSCTILWWVFFCEKLQRLVCLPASWEVRGRAVLARLAERDAGLALLAFVICFLALVLTGSRAGLVCSVLALVVATAITFRALVKQLPPTRRLVVAGILVSGALLLGGAASHRFDAQGLNDEGRIDVYRATWRLIRDHPFLGTGVGSFQDVFPLYRSASDSIWGHWQFAHNTPLELAADIGLPGAVLVCAAYVTAIGLLLRGAVIRRRENAIPIAAAGVGLIGGLHSLVDFPLQVPGFAMVCMAAIGAGLSQAFRSEKLITPNLEKTPRVS